MFYIKKEYRMTDQEIIQITQNSLSMALAAKRCGMAYTTFIRKAKKLGIYKPNPGGKGMKGEPNTSKIPLNEILEGKYPQYQTYKLKIRLIEEGIFKDECQICGWNKKPEGSKFTPCELDHIDGNPENHKLKNLRLLCPNCHSLTKTYRFRRGKTNERRGRKLLDRMVSNSVNSEMTTPSET